MENCVHLLLLVLSHVVLISGISNVSVQHSGKEFLDSENVYWLSWNINAAEEVIYFRVIAETKGYVGFGISPNGGMRGADIFIAGVDQDGNVYSGDFHGKGNFAPVKDDYENWKVTFAKENNTHTELHFHRLLNTCDDQDFEIGEGTFRVIWAIGDTDKLSHHAMERRGTKSINFYLSDASTFDTSGLDKLEISVTMEIPAEETTVWCTIHKVSGFSEERHIVAGEPILPNKDARLHVHHFLVYRCVAPNDEDMADLFDKWVGHPGDHCFDQTISDFPYLRYCEGRLTFGWAVGGKLIQLPDEAGLVLQRKVGRNEYFALQVHYDNPELRKHVAFQTGARLYHTPNLRANEAGLEVIGHHFDRPALVIPPHTKDFVCSGHCSSECTEAAVSDEGMNVFGVFFHAHLTARKMKLRHFRGNTELPPLGIDRYFDFNFQQLHMLSPHVKVLKGDLLTVECTFDSTSAEGGRAVIGGLGTKQEMCQAWVYHYPKVDTMYCGSGQVVKEHFELLGVTDFISSKTVEGDVEQYVVLEPENLAGEYLDSVSYKVNWTREFREYFQREKRFGEQASFCYGNALLRRGTVKYPDNLVEYKYPDTCAGKRLGNVGARTKVFSAPAFYAIVFLVVLVNY